MIIWSSCRPSPQGASCRSWAVKRTEPAVESARVSQRPDRFDGRGDAPFHVRGPAAGQPAILDFGRHERQVDRVEMPVKLKRSSRPAALEPDHDGRRFGVSSTGSVDLKTVRRRESPRGGR